MTDTARHYLMLAFVAVILGALALCAQRASALEMTKTLPEGGTLTFTGSGLSQSMSVQPGTYHVVVTEVGGARVGHRRARRR